jgi:hypothetical protein
MDFTYLDYHANNILFAFFIISIIFIMIGHLFKDGIQTKLQVPLVHIEAFDLDLWSYIHFMLFAMIGFVKPDHAFTFFTVGVAFEIFEDCLSSNKTTKLINCTKSSNKNSIIGSVMCNGYEDSYWYGKIDDIAINLMGYVAGNGFRRTFF